MNSARRQIYEVVGKIADGLVGHGFMLPDALKRRDPREPGRAEKEEFEDKLEKLILKYFAAQEEQLRAYLQQFSGGIQDVEAFVDSIPASIFDSPEAKAALVALLIGAAIAGIVLFAAEEAGGLAVDWTIANTEATAWAREYSTGWFLGLDETTQNALREALRLFITQPGFTIGDVMDMLPFDGARARRIAITEITRAYGESAQVAGMELARAFPDIRVVKTWFTNNDELVCPICKPLNTMVVSINEFFTTEEDKSLGLTSPPAHVNCRCWMRVRTRINAPNNR